MTIPHAILWLLPALFVVHDGEEVVWLVPWLERHEQPLKRRFPVLSRRLYARPGGLSRGVFAAMAGEELLLLLAVTLHACWTGNPVLWLALLLAFGLHLVLHLVQAVAVRGYVPSLVTSLACLPVVGWMLAVVIHAGRFSLAEIACCAAGGCAVAALNLYALHALTARIGRSGCCRPGRRRSFRGH